MRVEEVIKQEIDAAARDALVNTYVWINQRGWVVSPDLKVRAEKWADHIIASGKTMEVLEATMSKPCPECGR